MTIPPNGNVCTRHESGSISPVQALVGHDLTCIQAISSQKLHPRTASNPGRSLVVTTRDCTIRSTAKSGTFKTAKEQREAGQILCFPNHSVPEDRLPTAPASLRTFHLCFGTKTKSNLSKQFFLEKQARARKSPRHRKSCGKGLFIAIFFVRSSHPARFALA